MHNLVGLGKFLFLSEISTSVEYIRSSIPGSNDTSLFTFVKFNTNCIYIQKLNQFYPPDFKIRMS